MKKLTQIISLDFSSNFLSEENKEGKTIDAMQNPVVRFVPFENVSQITNSVRGMISEIEGSLQLFVPFNFENNAVDSSVLNSFPGDLNFYISIADAEKFAYCGLNFNVGENQLLYLTPKNATKEYIFRNSTIQAKTCGKANVISAEDVVMHIPSDISRDKFIALAGEAVKNINTLEIEIGGKKNRFSTSGNLAGLHNLLKTFINKQVAIKIRNAADNKLVKKIDNGFVTNSSLPAHVIGIVSIPKSAIKSNEKNFAKYAGLNHFAVHFPNVKAKLEIEINISSFANSDKLFMDENPIPFTVANHSARADWKTVSCSVDNYILYLNKQKNILLKTGNKTYEMPVNPMLTFDYKTGKSKINITKNIN